jgi:hypothetical protein
MVGLKHLHHPSEFDALRAAHYISIPKINDKLIWRISQHYIKSCRKYEKQSRPAQRPEKLLHRQHILINTEFEHTVELNIAQLDVAQYVLTELIELKVTLLARIHI